MRGAAMSFTAAASGLVVFLLSVSVAQGQDGWGVTYSSTEICAVKGSSVDISCTYSSNDSITSKFWFSPERSHQGQIPSQPEDLSEDSQYAGRVQILETERGSTLRISDLRDSDSAQYRFTFKTPSFEWRSDLPGTTLTVTALQVQVTIKSFDKSNRLAELKCHSSCSPAGVSYVWFNNGNKFTTTSISSYEGWIQLTDRISCALEGHEAFSSPTVYAPKRPSVSVSVSGGIEEGNSVTLTCSSDANPAAEYKWYKMIGIGVSSYFNEGPQLVFSYIQFSDSARYLCIAENELGGSPSASFRMDVKYAPRLPSVSVSPSAEINERSSVTLTCSSDANPAAKYTWYKKNGNRNVPLFSDGPQLVLSSIQSSDSGQYFCRAKNKLGGSTSENISIVVKYAPKLPSVSVSPSAGIEEGSSVTLTCSSDANPAASYTWYKENEDSPKASGQIFTISDFRAEHSGSYSCGAQNKFGRSNSTFHLSVAAGSRRLLPFVTIPVVLLAVISLSVFLWIRKKRASRDSAEPEERHTEEYATVHFSNNRANPLSFNMRAAQQLGHTEPQ